MQWTKLWADKKGGKKTKVTMADITQYNLDLVLRCSGNKEALRKYLRHGHLYKMMRQGLISKNKRIWGYL